MKQTNILRGAQDLIQKSFTPSEGGKPPCLILSPIRYAAASASIVESLPGLPQLTGFANNKGNILGLI